MTSKDEYRYAEQTVTDEDGTVELEVVVLLDDFYGNPRTEYDCFGTLLFFDNRLNADEHNFKSPEDFFYWLGRDYIEDSDEELSAKEIADRFRNAGGIIYDVHAYEHGNIALTLAGPEIFPDLHWDTRLIGWTFATPDEVKEFGGADPSSEAKKALNNELEIFEAYLNGEVYRYEIYDPNPWCEDEREVDSCGGIFGDPDYCLEAGIEQAKLLIERRRISRNRHLKTLIQQKVPISYRQEILDTCASFS